MLDWFIKGGVGFGSTPLIIFPAYVPVLFPNVTLPPASQAEVKRKTWILVFKFMKIFRKMTLNASFFNVLSCILQNLIRYIVILEVVF